MANEPHGRILVVDDEENILTALQGVLEDEGHEVVLARQGAEALELIDRRSPDVILLDVWMPGLDGIETLRQIKASHPDVQVIMVTGHGTIETAVQATKMGAFEFFEKPLSIPAVLSSVRHALEYRQLLLDNRRLRRLQTHPYQLLGDSQAMVEVRARIEDLARSDRDVLIVGELGVGKKLVARLIHLESDRRDRPFSVFSVSPGGADLQARLFGRDGQGGLLDDSVGGTLYLDGAERLPTELLARVRNSRQSHRLRVICGALTAEGLELGDDVERIDIPALRSRPDDVTTLARFFLWQYGTEYGRPERALDPDTERALGAYPWPSNVEELKNVMERLALTSKAPTVRLSDLPIAILSTMTPLPGTDLTFAEAERAWEKQFLAATVKKHRGDLGESARSLGLTEDVLTRKLRSLGLTAPSPSTSAGTRRQRTLARSMVLGGQGLHSGVKTGLILNPLPPNSGIQFGSISHSDTVPALVDYVDRTGYATGVRKGQAVAKTIEHFMAALHAYGISNLLIKLSEEVPIMDGSAYEFCKLIEDGGIEEQDAEVTEIRVDRLLEVGNSDDPSGEWIRIEPSERFEVIYDLHYPSPVGHQHFEWKMEGPESFRDEIAPARTFGFLNDIEKLEEMGLGTGGRLSNFILIDDEKVVNTELRFPDELVRHKILDITGDFYLLGRPIRGRIRARKTGHADNVALLKLLQETYVESIPGA